MLLEVRDLARRHTVGAVEALATLMVDRTMPPLVRLAAARELLDRGHGRPRPAPDDLRNLSIEHMTDEQLAAICGDDEPGDGVLLPPP